MIKYFIPLTLLAATFAFAEVKADVEAEQPNYELFEIGAYTYRSLLIESVNAKNHKKSCIYSQMAVNFFINNIKYVEQFNQTQNDITYQELLTTLQSDYYKNKEGCDRLLAQ